MKGDMIKVKMKTNWGEIVEVDGWPVEAGLCVVRQLTQPRFAVACFTNGLALIHGVHTLKEAIDMATWLAERWEDEWVKEGVPNSVGKDLVAAFPQLVWHRNIHYTMGDQTPVNNPLEGRILDGIQ